MKAMPASAARRLYYTTTNTADFSPKEAVDADEGFREVFEIGRRETRHMKMPATGYNLPDWTDVQSRRDFDQKPFLDLQENRLLARTFKEVQKPLPALAPVNATQYTRDFQGTSADQLKKARRDPLGGQEPDGGSSRTLGGKGQLMVSTSLSHEHYVPLKAATRARSVPKLASNIKVTPTSAKSWKSQSNRTYAAAPGCAPIAPCVLQARPGRVPPRDLTVLMDGIKRDMQHSFSSPAGNLSVLQRPF